MKLNNKLILTISIIIVCLWMFKRSYEKYTNEVEKEEVKKQIEQGELTQADVDAVMKFIKS